MAKSKTTAEQFDFEAALAELNQLVEQMEHGGLSLEASLQSFERGITLARSCSTALKSAEQKVQILVEQNGQANLAPFDDQVDET